MINAAQVTSWGAPPAYTALPAPPVPSPESGIVQIRVLATGVHQLVRSRAAGKHYTSGPLPHVVGVDGVGSTIPEGKLVYFITLRTGGGSFAEIVNVPKSYVFDLPEGAKPEGRHPPLDVRSDLHAVSGEPQVRILRVVGRCGSRAFTCAAHAEYSLSRELVRVI